MAWLFFIAAGAAFLFTLPGGTRSPADRQMAQGIGFAALASGFLALKIIPIGLLIAVVGSVFYGIGWFKNRLLGGQFQDIQDEPSGAKRPARPMAGQMSRDEALAVLGLPPDAEADSIREAHRRMIAKAHPDSGGSDYLASKVNEARDVLLSDR